MKEGEKRKELSEEEGWETRRRRRRRRMQHTRREADVGLKLVVTTFEELDHK